MRRAAILRPTLCQCRLLLGYNRDHFGSRTDRPIASHQQVLTLNIWRKERAYAIVFGAMQYQPAIERMTN